MTPQPTRNDVINRLVSHAIPLCSLPLAFSKNGNQKTYLMNLYAGKFFGHSTFPSCISKVVKMISKKEMVWPNANAVVAMVTYLESIWDTSEMNHPRNPMGSALLAFPLCNSIPSVSDLAFPDPACGSLFNLRPKPFQWISEAILAKMTLIGFNSERCPVDFCAASATLGKHLKTFLLGVKGAIGSSRWLPFIFSFNRLFFNE